MVYLLASGLSGFCGLSSCYLFVSGAGVGLGVACASVTRLSYRFSHCISFAKRPRQNLRNRQKLRYVQAVQATLYYWIHISYFSCSIFLRTRYNMKVAWTAWTALILLGYFEHLPGHCLGVAWTQSIQQTYSYIFPYPFTI